MVLHVNSGGGLTTPTSFLLCDIISDGVDQSG